jgi:hypothetical protein
MGSFPQDEGRSPSKKEKTYYLESGASAERSDVSSSNISHSITESGSDP